MNFSFEERINIYFNTEAKKLIHNATRTYKNILINRALCTLQQELIENLSSLFKYILLESAVDLIKT